MGKGDIPGKYGISFWPSDQNYNYVTHYNINTVDTWEYKTITIPGATGGTWLTDNGTGLGIWWDFGVGTTYSTATTETWGQSGYKFAPSYSLQMIKTNGAKFRMTGVQLEVGKNATEFEHRSYGEELALCQRYYQEIGNGNNGANEIVEGGYGTTAMVIYNSIKLLVEMRTVPTLSQVGNIYTVNVSQPGSLSGHVGRKSFSISNTVTSAGTWVYATNTSAYFTLSAEL